MPQHIPPLRNQLLPKNSQRLESREPNVLEVAFLLHHVTKDCSGRMELTVPKQVDHIVKVTRSRPFAEGTNFFSKYLFESVAARRYAFGRGVGIYVSHGPHDRRQYQNFIGSEIKFDARYIGAPWRYRTAIADPPLAAKTTPSIVEYFEPALIGRQLDTRRFVEPVTELGEPLFQETRVQLRRVRNCKIQVLGEPIRLEKALLETGAAFENPRSSQERIAVNASEQPTEDVIFFDNARFKAKLIGEPQDFRTVNHAAFVSIQLRGTHTRQRLTSLRLATAGSSFAIPVLSRLRHSTISFSGPPRRSARNPSLLNTAPLPRRSATLISSSAVPLFSLTYRSRQSAT